jgi:hypothetical protein
MRHRIACNFAAQAEGVDAVAIIKRLLLTVPEPEVAKYVDSLPPETKDMQIEQI